MRALLTSLTLCAATAMASPAILLQPALGTPARVTLSGRVLTAEPAHSSSIVGANLRALTSANWVGAAVELSFGGRTATVKTGHDGDFKATLEAPPGQAFEVGLGTASAHVKGASATALVNVVSTSAPFIVVSDFDDTVAVTNVLHTGALLKASLGQDAATQPVVEGMPGFYGCLHDVSDDRPGFMLVSGSPIQYLPRVRAFLTLHGFPPFGIALRELGPKTLSNYKQPIIRAVLKAVPNPVVFIGDSGEHDPEVYRQLRDEFPGRVKAIYIRDAGHADEPGRFDGMLLFKDPKEALADAVAKGLAKAGCEGTTP